MSWGYKMENGPQTWADRFPDAAGERQSPVDIKAADAVFDEKLCSSPLTFKYKTEGYFEAMNTGKSFKVNLRKFSELSGGPLSDKYRLEQFHLHWGSCDDHGSEHTIDGETFAAELHLVHWNCSKYKTFIEAVDKSDGLAVVGVMIEPGEHHRCFQDMVEAAKILKACGKSCKFQTIFNPANLLPENTQDFWTYHGSLTTPPCYESVQWIVLREPVQYSPKQLNALRGLTNDEHVGECIVDNYRPPLPLGNRKIRASF